MVNSRDGPWLSRDIRPTRQLPLRIFLFFLSSSLSLSLSFDSLSWLRPTPKCTYYTPRRRAGMNFTSFKWFDAVMCNKFSYCTQSLHNMASWNSHVSREMREELIAKQTKNGRARAESDRSIHEILRWSTAGATSQLRCTWVGEQASSKHQKRKGDRCRRHVTWGLTPGFGVCGRAG